jgi:hypothetical protein
MYSCLWMGVNAHIVYIVELQLATPLPPAIFAWFDICILRLSKLLLMGVDTVCMDHITEYRLLKKLTEGGGVTAG